MFPIQQPGKGGSLCRWTASALFPVAMCAFMVGSTLLLLLSNVDRSTVEARQGVLLLSKVDEGMRLGLSKCRGQECLEAGILGSFGKAWDLSWAGGKARASAGARRGDGSGVASPCAVLRQLEKVGQGRGREQRGAGRRSHDSGSAGTETLNLMQIQATPWSGGASTDGGTTPYSRGPSALSFPTFRVRGSGALRCTVGELCAFTLHIVPKATWNVTIARPLAWDLMVTLEGPALLHAPIEQAVGSPFGQGLVQLPGRTFSVTYRSWDAGLYSVTVTNPCFTLEVPGVQTPLYQDKIGELATWQLVIGEATPALVQQQPPMGTPQSLGSFSSMLEEKEGKGLTPPSLRGARSLPWEAPGSRSLDRASSADVHEEACRDTVQGRWVRGKGAPDPEPWRANETADANTGRSGLSPSYQGHGKDYGWEPYPCATWQPLGRVLGSLRGKGVREVVFVGDSHLRFLLVHTVFLLVGWAPKELARAQFDFTITLALQGEGVGQAKDRAGFPEEGKGSGSRQPGAAGASLVSWRQLPLHLNSTEKLLSWSQEADGTMNRTMDPPSIGSTGNGQPYAFENSTGTPQEQKRLAEERLVNLSNSTVHSNSTDHTISLSFYWVDGVFKNGEFGCSTRGSFSRRPSSFPLIHGNPDLAVLDSGAWSAFRCQRPSLAYSSHLSEFLEDMVTKLQQKGCKKIAFYGSTPNSRCLPGAPAATNSLIRFQSKLAQVVAASYGIPFFNTWEVIAPRYTSDCGVYNTHYTCFRVMKSSTGGMGVTLGGPVGEALAWSLFQFLDALTGAK